LKPTVTTCNLLNMLIPTSLIVSLVYRKLPRNISMHVVARWLNERNIYILGVKSVKKLEGVLG